MKDQKIFTVLLMLFTSFFLVSCLANKTIKKITVPIKVTKPKIEYSNYKITKTTDKKVSVNLKLIANNPNNVALKNILIGTELFTQNKRFFVGNNIKLVLAPNTKTEINIPVDVIYNDILKVAQEVAKKVLDGKTSIQVLAKITVVGTPTLYNVQMFSFDYKTEKSFKVGILVKKDDDKKDEDKKDEDKKDGDKKDEDKKDDDKKDDDKKDGDKKDDDKKDDDKKDGDKKDGDKKDEDKKDEDKKDGDKKDEDSKDKDSKG